MAEEKIVTITEQEFKSLTDKLGKDANEKIQGLFAEIEKGNGQALTELKTKMDELSSIEGKNIQEFVKNIQNHTNALEAELKATKESIQNKAPKMSFEESMVKSIEAFGFEKIQKSVRNGERMPMEIKTAIDHSITDSVGNGSIIPVYEPGIAGKLKRNPSLYELLPGIPWSRSTVNWVEINAEAGTIAAKKEAAASLSSDYAAHAKFPQRSYTVHKKSMELSKVPVYAKVTEEMVENINDFVQFIRSELVVDLLLQYDNDMLKGNGTAPNMKGLQHADYYTAAAIPGDYTLPSGITPSEVHVLRAIITQMLNGYANPSIILMHPTDVMKLDLAVDKNGQFLVAPFSGRDNTAIKGVPIYEHANLSTGTFHVIDGTKPKHFIQRGLSLRLWDQVDSDPLYDLMTMTASVKGGVRVKTNEKIGNIYGTFSTLITALTAGS
jgi:HK97 family phage major capsid protein